MKKFMRFFEKIPNELIWEIFSLNLKLFMEIPLNDLILCPLVIFISKKLRI
jgi:hypothetical protein